MNVRARGWALMDLMVTIALVSVALSIAAVLMSRSMTLADRAADADAVVRSFDQMQTMLRRDVAGAATLSVAPDRLTTALADWRIESTRATRTEGAHERVFPITHATLRFDRAAHGATLVVESPTHTTRLALLNVTSWGKESLR
jgi:type II secretory pathway pseudopilin PulG